MTVPVRLGVIFLCHNELDVASSMVRIWHDGGAAVAIHVDSRADEVSYQTMRQSLADLTDVTWVDRRQCEWGMFTMVEVIQAAATALLHQFEDVTHVLVASGSCLPLRPLARHTPHRSQLDPLSLG